MQIDRWTFLIVQLNILNFLKCVIFLLIIDGKINKKNNLHI